MTTEKIYSPIFDKNIQKNLNNSPIWQKAYKEDEIKDKHGLVEYTIRFSGLKPIQVTKIKKLL